MNYFINYYMKHSKDKMGLCGVLGIMEFMNVPLKLLYLLVPIIAYICALFGADHFIFPIIPTVIQPVYELGVNILLIVIFVLLMIAVIVTVGRKVYDEETALFVEAFYNLHTNPNRCPAKLYLIYKRTKNGITVRKIYSHETKEAWNERSKEILQKFNAHFVDSCRFQYAKGNSCIIIMKTAEGIEKPIKTEWHDSALDKDMDDVATRL